MSDRNPSLQNMRSSEKATEKTAAYEVAALRDSIEAAKDKAWKDGENRIGMLCGFLLTLIDDRERHLEFNRRIVEEVLPKVLQLEDANEELAGSVGASFSLLEIIKEKK